jgi:hypothetical protein
MQPHESGRRRRSALGVVAYLLVPGERRRRAATHFRRAGFEAVKGVGALMQPEGPPEGAAAQSRQRIEIE